MQAGSIVTINAPFNADYPGWYPVIYLYADGSAAVMVPGWVQTGATFAPLVQGANFAAKYLTDTGVVVDVTKLTIPTDVAATPAAPSSIQIVSTSTPSLNGYYPIDALSQQNVSSVTLYILVNNKFPGGATSFVWSDISGTPHVFTSVAEWSLFASAMADFVVKVAMGQTPAQPVVIA